MEVIWDILRNDVFVRALVAYFTAQFLKIFTILYKEKRIVFSQMWGSGGMPSSHAATVCALAFGCAAVYGADSAAFAISGILAAIVMYDAMGVRRAAGEQARVLNHMVADLFSGKPEYAEKALKELIGHTPLQVFMGGILGLLIGLFFPSLAFLAP